MTTSDVIGLRELPPGWETVEESMYETAVDQTMRAFGTERIDRAVDSLEAYFDPHGRYAGNTFLSVSPNEPFAISAADLWAVTTLSMSVPPAVGRTLLDPGPVRDLVERGLRLLPESLTLDKATPEVLQVLETTYGVVRSQLPSPRASAVTTNQWVLASKLMARKRPLLFPVRDALVCRHLAAGAGLGKKPGQLGWFRRDLQVFAHLVAHPEVVARLVGVRHALARAQPSWSLGHSDLRLLDSVLWMAARRAKAAMSPVPTRVGTRCATGRLRAPDGGGVEQLRDVSRSSEIQQTRGRSAMSFSPSSSSICQPKHGAQEIYLGRSGDCRKRCPLLRRCPTVGMHVA